MVFVMVSCLYYEDINIYDVDYNVSADIPNVPNEPREPPPELPVTVLPPREHHEYEAAMGELEIDGDIMFFALNSDISVHITGRSSPSEISVRVINNTEARLNISLPLGVYFSAERENAPNVADMVLTESVDVSVSAGENINIIASVAQMNIGDIARADDVFSLAILENDDPLLALLYIFERYHTEFEVIQAAIWYY